MRPGNAWFARVMDSLGGSSTSIATCPGKQTSIALIASAEERIGRLDTIFNNAGIEQPVTPSTEVTEELFDRVIAINLKGVFFGCKHAIPALLQGGRGHDREQLLGECLRECGRQHLLRGIEGRDHVDDPRACDRIFTPATSG